MVLTEDTLFHHQSNVDGILSAYGPLLLLISEDSAIPVIQILTSVSTICFVSIIRKFVIGTQMAKTDARSMTPIVLWCHRLFTLAFAVVSIGT